MRTEDEGHDHDGNEATLKAKPSARAVSRATRMALLKPKLRRSRLADAQGEDIHATMWSGWRRLMTDQMSVEWTRSMMRINESVAAVFARERASRLDRGDALEQSPGDALGLLSSDDDITLEHTRIATCLLSLSTCRW